jgi:hypothetical protein
MDLIQLYRGVAFMLCPKCKDETLFRLERKGFLRVSVFPLFGYFPWQCRGCKSVSLLRVRGKRRRESSQRRSESLNRSIP